MSEKRGALPYANVTEFGSGWHGGHLIVLHIAIPFAGAMYERPGSLPKASTLKKEIARFVIFFEQYI